MQATYERDLWKRPMKETYERDLWKGPMNRMEESYKRVSCMRPMKETYERDLWKRPMRETYARDLWNEWRSHRKESHASDLWKRPMQETYERDLCKRNMKETYERELLWKRHEMPATYGCDVTYTDSLIYSHIQFRLTLTLHPGAHTSCLLSHTQTHEYTLRSNLDSPLL
jgi:hypothetical protein